MAIDRSQSNLRRPASFESVCSGVSILWGDPVGKYGGGAEGRCDQPRTGRVRTRWEIRERLSGATARDVSVCSRATNGP